MSLTTHPSCSSEIMTAYILLFRNHPDCTHFFVQKSSWLHTYCSLEIILIAHILLFRNPDRTYFVLQSISFLFRNHFVVQKSWLHPFCCLDIMIAHILLFRNPPDCTHFVVQSASVLLFRNPDCCGRNPFGFLFWPLWAEFVTYGFLLVMTFNHLDLLICAVHICVHVWWVCLCVQDYYYWDLLSCYFRLCCKLNWLNFVLTAAGTEPWSSFFTHQWFHRQEERAPVRFTF